MISLVMRAWVLAAAVAHKVLAWTIYSHNLGMYLAVTTVCLVRFLVAVAVVLGGRLVPTLESK